MMTFPFVRVSFASIAPQITPMLDTDPLPAGGRPSFRFVLWCNACSILASALSLSPSDCFSFNLPKLYIPETGWTSELEEQLPFY